MPDSVIPPQHAPNPDGIVAPNFTFDRLGLRVPTVLVSPYIPQVNVETIFDHTSLLATAEKRFGLEPLTERDKHANTFEDVLSLDSPRSESDLPGLFPIIKPTVFTDIFQLAKSGIGALEDLTKDLFTKASKVPQSELQTGFIELAKGLSPAESGIFKILNHIPLIETEHEAAVFVLHAISKHLNL